MATIKAYTDIEQSKKLADILPLESADMYWSTTLNTPVPYLATKLEHQMYKEGANLIPCWSLAALLEQFPYELCDDDGNSVYLEINKEDDLYQLVYTDPYENFENVETDRCEHFVDACVAMIEKLNELNLL